MNYDWHVLFTRYCHGINDGSVTGHTPEEDDAAYALLLAIETPAQRKRQDELHDLNWLKETAWESESSGKYKRQQPAKRKSAA